MDKLMADALMESFQSILLIPKRFVLRTIQKRSQVDSLGTQCHRLILPLASMYEAKC